MGIVGGLHVEPPSPSKLLVRLMMSGTHQDDNMIDRACSHGLHPHCKALWCKHTWRPDRHTTASHASMLEHTSSAPAAPHQVEIPVGCSQTICSRGLTHRLWLVVTSTPPPGPSEVSCCTPSCRPTSNLLPGLELVPLAAVAPSC